MEGIEKLKRNVAYIGDSEKVLDSWPEDVKEMVKTNLQALQQSKLSAFSELPDWVGTGTLTEKGLQGKHLKGARQLTIKHKNSYRVAYIATIGSYVVVLHCFTKQKEGKQKKDMVTVEARLATARAKIDVN